MRLRLFVLILLLAAAGCGPKVAPVSGKVTFDDKPLVNATVIFMPDSDQMNPGPGSKAKTDQDGQFSLELMSGDTKGALVGKHKVSITAYEGDDKIPSSGPDMVFRKLLVPERYNGRTELTFDVPSGGSTSANFDLVRDPDAVKK
jgi:hypothetical protein